VFLEPKVIDYLIVHELAHLKYKNHSKRYWQQVASIMPDFKVRQQKLKKLSQLIFCWGTKISQLDQDLSRAKAITYVSQ
jgi:predicted metal-dependent hydrolase